MDGVSPLEGDAKPEPGDVSICMDCGAILRVMEGDNFAPEGRPEVLSDPQILKLQAAALEVIDRVKKGWKPLICPCCDGLLPEELRAYGGGLKPGIVIICAYCANVILFSKDGVFVPETDEELLSSEAMVAARKFIQETIDNRKARAN
jgi:RNase P subunit RPR2